MATSTPQLGADLSSWIVKLLHPVHEGLIFLCRGLPENIDNAPVVISPSTYFAFQDSLLRILNVLAPARSLSGFSGLLSDSIFLSSSSVPLHFQRKLKDFLFIGKSSATNPYHLEGQWSGLYMFAAEDLFKGDPDVGMMVESLIRLPPRSISPQTTISNSSSEEDEMDVDTPAIQPAGRSHTGRSAIDLSEKDRPSSPDPINFLDGPKVASSALSHAHVPSREHRSRNVKTGPGQKPDILFYRILRSGRNPHGMLTILLIELKRGSMNIDSNVHQKNIQSGTSIIASRDQAIRQATLLFDSNQDQKAVALMATQGEFFSWCIAVRPKKIDLTARAAERQKDPTVHYKKSNLETFDGSEDTDREPSPDRDFLPSFSPGWSRPIKLNENAGTELQKLWKAMRRHDLHGMQLPKELDRHEIEKIVRSALREN